MEENEILDEAVMNFEPTDRKRHGCVTAWLAFSIFLNSVITLVYFFLTDEIVDNLPGGKAEDWMVLSLGAIGIINVASCVMLWFWKRVGFWIFAVTSIITFGLNMAMGVNIINSLMGLGGVVFFYVVLQIKEGRHTAWELLD